MRPKEKGWLKEYLDFRKDLLRDLTNESRKASHPEQSLYRIIQPTGIMYGQSVDALELPQSQEWSEVERMKVLLAESLISSSLLFHEKSIKNPEELGNVLLKSLESIAGFYNNIFPELSTSTKTFFGRKKPPIEVAEKLLDKRIEHSNAYNDNFWAQLFHNSLLFLDIFIYGQWIHTNADRIVSDFFKYEKEELRFSVVKVIAAAAHANTTIEYEERKLLEYFLQGTGLTPEKKKEATEIFDLGIEVEELNLPTNNSWLLKKYFLEMAILTIWADKRVEEAEQGFLSRLCDYLGFTDEDLENSMMAIEGFVLEHWNELEKLQNKQSYAQASEQYMQRLGRIAENNRARLVREMKDNQELMALLRQARSSELNEQSKKRLEQLMIVVLKAIPTFVVISLPNRFLTLPVLMKILPPGLVADTLN
ncbi:MAG: hypothetical protein AB7K37_02635 [Cyclobacteriaceae bacterium]